MNSDEQWDIDINWLPEWEVSYNYSDGEIYISNIGCADNQGASSESGYRVWLITRSHDQQFFLLILA